MDKYGGFSSNGNYQKTKNKRPTKCYYTWLNMIRRCNDTEIQKGGKNSTYKENYVCKEWYNFQNFAEWYEENYYEVENEIMCLDKDILVKNNKVYY